MNRIARVIGVSWSIGMGKPSLAEVMQRTIDSASTRRCLGVEQIDRFQWLMLFSEEIVDE